MGILQAASGEAVITPQRRFTRAPQGSPSSLWEVVRKYHYTPVPSSRLICQIRSKACVGRSDSLCSTSSKLLSWRRALCRYYTGFCACNMVYSVVTVPEGMRKTCPSNNRDIFRRIVPPHNLIFSNTYANPRSKKETDK